MMTPSQELLDYMAEELAILCAKDPDCVSPAGYARLYRLISDFASTMSEGDLDWEFLAKMSARQAMLNIIATELD